MRLQVTYYSLGTYLIPPQSALDVYINFYKLYQQCYIWYDDDVAMHGARKKGQNLLAIDKTLGIRQACQVHWSQPYHLPRSLR